MSQITATVIEDSCQSIDKNYLDGGKVETKYVNRLTTFLVSYPRFVHAELMTHRVFSRNASSSRAIPVATMIERATKQTAYPVYWGKNQKGMQADEELSPKDIERAKGVWLAAAETAARHAQEMIDIGVHKQIANRLIENFQNIEVVVTSTMWANWYALRNHKDAQPEIQAVARAMLKAHRASVPKLLGPGEWHLPFVGEAERRTLAPDVACKVSAARCARTSYLTHDKKEPKLDEDAGLFGKLMGGDVVHASPTEHQARMIDESKDRYCDGGPGYSSVVRTDLGGNLGKDWVQFRKTIPNEVVREYDEFE